MTFERAGENLVKALDDDGKLVSYYLRASVGGKSIRRSLKTTSERTAKTKRDGMLLKLRPNSHKAVGTLSLPQAIQLTKDFYFSYPKYKDKPRSLDYRLELLAVLKATLPQRAVHLWTKPDLRDWWTSKKVSSYSNTRRNNMLGTFRKMMELAMERGVRFDDPSDGIDRLPVRSEPVPVPSKEDFKALVAKMRETAPESADMVEFMAYCGMRPGEAREALVGHIGEESIEVVGGESGTKNHEKRVVPITPAMRDLLDRMELPKRGKVFGISNPRKAIESACKALKLDHYTPKTFRHLFATTCIESGIDFATVARWLGHRDGGALLAKVYSHLRDQHSQEQAGKVKF
jgi:integrase